MTLIFLNHSAWDSYQAWNDGGPRLGGPIVLFRGGGEARHMPAHMKGFQIKVNISYRHFWPVGPQGFADFIFTILPFHLSLNSQSRSLSWRGERKTKEQANSHIHPLSLSPPTELSFSSSCLFAHNWWKICMCTKDLQQPSVVKISPRAFGQSI